MLCLVLSLVSLCDPLDYRWPGSSVRGNSPGKSTGVGCHALSRGFSQPRDQTQVSHLAGRFFTIWVTRKPNYCICLTPKKQHTSKVWFPSFLKQGLHTSCPLPSYTFSQSYMNSHYLNCLGRWLPNCIMPSRYTWGCQRGVASASDLKYLNIWRKQ